MKLINMREFGDVAFVALVVALLVEWAVGSPRQLWVAGMHATFVAGLYIGKWHLRRP